MNPFFVWNNAFLKGTCRQSSCLTSSCTPYCCCHRAIFHATRTLTITHRLVITASAHEFAPQSRSGNRALEISVAEDLINTTGPPFAAQLHGANHSTSSPNSYNFSSNLHLNVQSTQCAATLSARFWARKCRLVWKQHRCPACSSPAFFSNLDSCFDFAENSP
jgi:hypothetical protein